MMKHSGDLISSRLMPPKVGPILRTVVMNSSTSCVDTSMSMESTSGEALEQNGLAFHHRLGGERAEIAHAENGGAVADHRDEVAF